MRFSAISCLLRFRQHRAIFFVLELYLAQKSADDSIQQLAVRIYLGVRLVFDTRYHGPVRR